MQRLVLPRQTNVPLSPSGSVTLPYSESPSAEIAPRSSPADADSSPRPRQLARMRSDPHRSKARRRRLDPRHQRQQIIGRMRAPCMRIRARVARNLRPSAEVQRKQLAPRLQSCQIFIAHPRMIQRPSQIKAEIIRAAQNSIRSVPGSMALIRFRTPLLLSSGHHIEQHPQNIRLLAEILQRRIVRQQPAPRDPSTSREARSAHAPPGCFSAPPAPHRPAPAPYPPRPLALQGIQASSCTIRH